MNNSLSTVDSSLLANVSGGADRLPNGENNAPLWGGPAGPSFDPGSFNPFGPSTPLTPPSAPAKPALPPEMQRWVDTMRGLEPWFQLGKKATAL